MSSFFVGITFSSHQPQTSKNFHLSRDTVSTLADTFRRLLSGEITLVHNPGPGAARQRADLGLRGRASAGSIPAMLG